jgi:monothiol glutaredoxin
VGRRAPQANATAQKLRKGTPFINAAFDTQGAKMESLERIRKQVTENPVVLYMKGTPDAPMCGFSAAAVQILEACGVDEVATVNVLDDADIRQGIKEFSNWPTIPQLYVRGEFVGGADIMREMYASGELQKMLQID